MRKTAPILLFLAMTAVLLPSGSSSPSAGEPSIRPLGRGSADIIPPYVDATDGIATRGAPWNPDPALWQTSATIAVRGSVYGESVAMVKLRLEGKGDPVNIRKPQQTVLITDDSGSMSWNDPSNMRVNGMQVYVDQMVPPDEISVGAYAQDLPSGNLAEIRQGLTTNYAAAKANIGTFASSGGTPIAEGLKAAVDELAPKKKSTHIWAIVHLTDGCWTSADPQPQVDRMVAEGIKLFNIGLYPDPSSGDKARCEPKLQQWSAQTGGLYFWVQKPSELADVYKKIAELLKYDDAGKPPATGKPMVSFKLTDAVEVVPGTFRCDSSSCRTPLPSNNPNPVWGNKGMKLEWTAPVSTLKIGDVWQVEFGVRAYKTGDAQRVNDVSQSFIEYDRYDGSPGGTDVFEQLWVDVKADIAPPGGVGLAEPPQPPPPPPHGGIPQLIPNPQQVPITYLQNLPVLHGMTVTQGIPLQYLLGSAMGLAVADRVKVKSRIRQGVKVAMASM